MTKGGGFVLSKESVKLLKWMKKNDEWLYDKAIEDRCPYYEYLAFKALIDGNYIATCINEFDVPEHDEYGSEYYPKQFRIGNDGKAYLESRVTDIIDKWITRMISVVAIVISLIALLSQLGILKLQAG